MTDNNDAPHETFIPINVRSMRSLIASGVSSGIIAVAVMGFIGSVAIGLASRALTPYDDTDGYGGKRSGLTQFTDCGTGVQYVGTDKGGLAVRVDKEGKPIVRPC